MLCSKILKFRGKNFYLIIIDIKFEFDRSISYCICIYINKLLV